MDKMRSGITLLITLSVIATMIALMGVMFKYLDVARTKAEVKASLIQSSLIKGDMLKILYKYATPENMKTLYDTPIAFGAVTGEFSFGLSCKPLANRLNIAWLSSHSKQNKFVEPLFESLTETANLKNSSSLLESIQAELDSGAGIRFGEQGRIMEKKGIITFKKFQQLMDDYYYKNDDKSIYSIDWKSYFSFGHNIDRLDGNFITAELLALMYGLDVQTVQSSYVDGDLKATIEELGESIGTYKKLFSKGNQIIAAAQCQASYGFRDGSYGMKFNYLAYSNEKKKVINTGKKKPKKKTKANQRIENFEFIGQ